MILSYQLLLLLLTPVFIWISLKHYINNKDGFYLWQRFGIKLPAVNKPIWFHCASVGEVIAAIPVIQLYQQKFPQQSILLTTNTVTGANICRQRLPFVTHCFLPLDYRFCSRHFLKKIKPKKLIILETEIWPNLFQLCHQFNIPVSIINGRLSKRSLNTNVWVKNIYRRSLAHVDKIYCRSESDADAYKILGADEKQVETIGNIKFAPATGNRSSAENLINRPYVLAASTRDGEERRIVEIWNKSQHNQLLLVIAPRHPDRKDEIINEIAGLSAEIKVRSQQQLITEQTETYLADTIGELQALFEHAEFVIMGGSFVNKGGHNILEPAAFSKAIIYGPSMQNFAAENSLFLENNAAIQAENDEQAISNINKLLTDPAYRNQLGTNAAELMQKNSDIGERYLQKIS